MYYQLFFQNTLLTLFLENLLGESFFKSQHALDIIT